MARRSSSRALAQETYREMARPSPDGFGGQALSAPSLTKKARALYEGAAVPVAEIARLCGVTERTIYKYAQRGNWTPRYRWSADGGRPRGACWRADRVAPAKGAAGRFIRRADKGKPYPTGLHAADPQAATRAKAACAEAARFAHLAEEKAKMAQLEEARFRAMEATADALREYNRYVDGRDRRGQAPRYDRAEQMLFRVADLALQRWEWLEARTVGDN